MHESEELADSNSEPDIALSQLLHDFKNQLGGLKLYAAYLKKKLIRNSLPPNEGIEVCDKIIQTIDALAARAKEFAEISKSKPIK